MLVYGDQARRVDPRVLMASINRRIEAVRHAPAGLQRHTALVAALIETGQLLQSLVDEAFVRRGRDSGNSGTGGIEAGLHALASAFCRSWDTGFAELTALPRLAADRELPSEVCLKVPEGFAFYAVYPEAYIEAARRLNLHAPARVIGIRSIGMSLGAVVAAALDTNPPLSVRPIGDPFDRRIDLEADLERDLLEGHHHYVIVDEGPGQSGSSFASVRQWLRERGVEDRRIALLPSHEGSPGAAASAEVRDWWAMAQREAADLGERLPELLTHWIEGTLGRLDRPLREISGGAWRALHYRGERDWPSVVPGWEARKFLAHIAGEPFLLKFAGLGTVSEEKLAIARSLHLDQLSPEPIGLVHGFLVERWIDGAAPLRCGEKPIAEIATYIATRARTLTVPDALGASVSELIDMTRRNISLEFGELAGDPMARWKGQEREIEQAMVPVRTDNRMLPHEWLRTTGGRLLKTDAVDHHQAHTLIGCQDVAWDVVAAIVEFQLNAKEAEQLIDRLERQLGRAIEPTLLAFYRPAYLAFRMGQMRMGQVITNDPSERSRIERSGNGYAHQLQHLLQRAEASTRRTSSIN